MFQPEITKPIAAGRAIKTPKAELVPTAVCTGVPNTVIVGTLSEPPPMPISDDI